MMQIFLKFIWYKTALVLVWNYYKVEILYWKKEKNDLKVNMNYYKYKKYTYLFD